MTVLLDGALKVSLVVSLALCASALLRKQSAALRHWVLAVGIACAAATPLLSVVLPSWQLPWYATRAPAQIVTTTETAQFELLKEAAITVGSTPVAGGGVAGSLALLATIWAAGAMASVGALLAGLTRLTVLARSSRPAGGVWAQQSDVVSNALGLRRRPWLLQTDHPALLVTWGSVRPKILLPRESADWTPVRVRMVLAHELAHVRRSDWMTQMLAELLRSVYWFNPLLWIACRRLRQESECACDDVVLGLGIDGTDYASELVELAQSFRPHGRPWLPAAAMARSSTLGRRVSAMLNHQTNRRPLAVSARIVVVVALLGLATSIAGLAAQAFSSVSGTIADVSGGGIPNARLSLVHGDTKAAYEVRSDAAGRFIFVGLPPGDYALEASYKGFSTHRDALAIVAGETLTRHVTLEVGTLQETITVAAGAAPDRVAQPVAGNPPRESGPCVPSSTGGHIVPPKKIRDVRPEFPHRLRDEKSEAGVTLQAIIGTEGRVTEVRALSSVDPDVEAAATAAVTDWQFTPTLLNCIAVEVKMTVTVTFRQR
ncbi:MAG: M56 family metallopeptidase [Acidobacteria bacterium]|nr:M56 family metallopeptidase [Acidobacteriota bacterium]